MEGPGSPGGELEVPIIGRDRKPLGVLRLDAGSGHGFAVEDRAVAVQFAQMASVVIESHQLFERIVEADRRKDEFLAMLAMLLEVLGHDVRIVHDAEEALGAVRDAEFDVMLIDIGLPGMNGFELAGRLRARPEAAHATLVALTGYGASEDRARPGRRIRHLVKPVEPGALEGLVTRVCEAGARNAP